VSLLRSRSLWTSSGGVLGAVICAVVGSAASQAQTTSQPASAPATPEVSPASQPAAGVVTTRPASQPASPDPVVAEGSTSQPAAPASQPVPTTQSSPAPSAQPVAQDPRDALRWRALNAEEDAAARLKAIAELVRDPDLQDLDTLAVLVADANEGIANAALAALEVTTAMSFSGDRAAARAWWNEQQALSEAAFWRHCVQRMRGGHAALQHKLDDVHSRLVRVLEANFLRAPDAERAGLLEAYLGDDNAVLRQLGLRLTQLHLSQGRPLDTLPDRVRAGVRKLSRSPSATERAEAIRTIASFREPQDAVMFIALLEDEWHNAVRRALINGLGYVGDGDATRKLLQLLARPDDPARTEVVTALGRLAERGALHDKLRPLVVPALLNVFQQTPRDAVALRERVVWAMSNIADPAFASALGGALDPNEALAVRQAAMRGVEALSLPETADDVAQAVSDEDAAVRQAAIDLMPRIGSRTEDTHLAALWTRLTNPPETEERLRALAWRYVPMLLMRRSMEDIDRWVVQVPGEGVAQERRKLELLDALIKGARSAEPADPARVGHLHARVARVHEALLDPATAATHYADAIAQLIAGRKSTAAGALRADLLRTALLGGRLDAALADQIRAVEVELDVQALWNAVKPEVQARLTAESVDRAAQMLAQLQAHAPAPWPEPIVAEMQALSEQAATLQAQAAEPPTSQPARPPAD
jgi:HEAT repeat protein